MLCMVEASRVKRESLWAFLACLYVAALERRRGRRLCGREPVGWEAEEFEQGAVGCRERQKRAESVKRRSACWYVSYYLASRVRSEREVVKRGAATKPSARRFGMRLR